MKELYKVSNENDGRWRIIGLIIISIALCLLIGVTIPYYLITSVCFGVGWFASMYYDYIKSK